ncbi:DUF2158 domain-containing protein, partial [Salmonella enterica subsp. enterica serovar Enteritidis]|nr:DUF2158 domain-containing protein [Salmonella enterica subsp. enterica serovar Enteritidis]
MQNCPSSSKVKTFHLIQEAGMVFSVS